MKGLRVIVHGVILVVADLAGIAVGALLAHRVTGEADQVWLQLPVAVVLTVVVFGLWIAALRLRMLERLQPRNANELGRCLFASIGWGVVLFVPVHYVTQGYVTSPGNLLALVLYQLPVNAVALFGSVAIAKPPLWEEPDPPVRPDRR